MVTGPNRVEAELLDRPQRRDVLMPASALSLKLHPETKRATSYLHDNSSPSLPDRATSVRGVLHQSDANGTPPNCEYLSRKGALLAESGAWLGPNLDSVLFHKGDRYFLLGGAKEPSPLTLFPVAFRTMGLGGPRTSQPLRFDLPFVLDDLSVQFVRERKRPLKLLATRIDRKCGGKP
jgi:hypothetical protein